MSSTTEREHCVENTDSFQPGTAGEQTAVRRGRLSVAGRYFYSTHRQLSADVVLDRRVLGRGMSGEVRLGHRVGSNTNVAVKQVVKRKLSTTAQGLVASEASLYLGLDHPHVARLECVYETKSTINFVMEYLEGGELYQVLRQKGRFSELEAGDAARQMLLSVSYLHAHGVVHRDLKPQNFVFESQDGGHLKLIDFGFAKHFDSQSRLSHPCGSVHYVAPEVLRRNYTEKADIWSLGVIVYMLLTGLSPWEPWLKSKEETLRRVVAGAPHYDRERFDPLSDEAKSFVMALLTADDSSRPSAEEALSHPWLLRHSHKDTLDFTAGSSIAQGFRGMAQAMPLRRACLSMAVWSLPAENEEVRRQFMSLGSLGSGNQGSVSLDSFKQAVGPVGVGSDEAEVLFERADLDGDGAVGYNSFVAASAAASPDSFDDNAVRLVFKRLCSRRRGITAKDLREAFGPDFEGVAAEELIREADLDGNGAISYKEFQAYLRTPLLDSHPSHGTTYSSPPLWYDASVDGVGEQHPSHGETYSTCCSKPSTKGDRASVAVVPKQVGQKRACAKRMVKNVFCMGRNK